MKGWVLEVEGVGYQSSEIVLGLLQKVKLIDQS